MAVFEIISGPDSSRSCCVDCDTFTIGAGDANEIAIEDATISPQHVRIDCEGGQFVLTDLDTASGTFVNGHRVKSVPLQVGDEITVGDTVIRFVDDAGAGAGEDDVILLEAVDEAPEAPSATPTPPPAPVQEQPATHTQPAAATPPPLPSSTVQKPPPRTAAPPRRARSQPVLTPVESDGTRRRIPLRKALLRQVTCPNCWHTFAPEDVWFISQHPDLMGDPVAGSSEFRRFLPNRFDLGGDALDERGLPTSQFACPRCHLQLPDCVLEVPPLFTSIVGSPASGKSYFLTAMTYELRQTLPRFALAFSDADPVANSPIHAYENALFLNSNPGEPTELPKTQLDDPRLHRIATISGIDTRFPSPLQFSMRPMRQHPKYRGAAGRTVVLYDNAGEDYLPQNEEAASAAVKHLAKSQIILLLFDPTQDPRFRKHCTSKDPQIVGGLRPDTSWSEVQYTQERIVRAMAIRLRRFLHLAESKTIPQPVIVIVPKFDIWQDMLDFSIDSEPFIQTDDDTPLQLDIDRIEAASQALSKLFWELCPDFMATVEGLSPIVRFIPTTSLGHSPVIVKRPDYTYYGVIPERIKPKWVTAPLLYCLCKWGKGTIETAATAE